MNEKQTQTLMRDLMDGFAADPRATLALMQDALQATVGDPEELPRDLVDTTIAAVNALGLLADLLEEQTLEPPVIDAWPFPGDGEPGQ